jgi:hypothetical protein
VRITKSPFLLHGILVGIKKKSFSLSCQLSLLLVRILAVLGGRRSNKTKGLGTTKINIVTLGRKFITKKW